MDNNAFKDLVRERTASASTKAIARKAVEDEFRKKKKRKRGGGYASSSDEEADNHKTPQQFHKQTPKRFHDDEQDLDAIQKDLAARYRDRAKERREGNASREPEKDNSSSNLWIVPHNIKGLDLALVRKERKELKRSEASDPKHLDSSQIRKELPSLAEANNVLNNFLSKSTNQDDSPNLTPSMNEYIEELCKWKDLDIALWDGTTRSASGKSLQRTKYAMAIDGHPSDTIRAWEIPRQYTLSAFFSEKDASGPLLSKTVLNKIDSVFRYRISLREQLLMAKEPGTNPLQTDPTSEETPAAIDMEKTVENDDKKESDDDDDDMFGGLDD